ncbi:transcriptional regulator [Polaribacter irgensii 23-P]|uniref:Transcriptional regulator n=1 Tax=Polaribacter irgensii 23-P TaxID=313594 RepID=A4BZ31_9FLAO|nr:GNAT family N-acetyltransferase [Polaribacter irgensii]EAR12424.1 transcriptional regulator [Polaribacter irgensii 23-P]
MLSLLKTTITKATQEDAAMLSKLSTAAFLPAHGHSAPKEIIDAYIAANFSEENFKAELSNPKFQYHLLYYEGTIAGFSKIIFNTEHAHIKAKNSTKMERLYLLEAFYNLGLGKELMDFNIALAKQHQQTGIWLFVWVENTKAIAFYKKTGFKNVGTHDFILSPTKTNPNHVLSLEF